FALRALDAFVSGRVSEAFWFVFGGAVELERPSSPRSSPKFFGGSLLSARSSPAVFALRSDASSIDVPCSVQETSIKPSHKPNDAEIKDARASATKIDRHARRPFSWFISSAGSPKICQDAPSFCRARPWTDRWCA